MFYLDLVSGHDFVARIFCSNEENGSPVRFLTDCGSVPGGSVSKPVPCRFNSLRFLNSGSGRFVGLLYLFWKKAATWKLSHHCSHIYCADDFHALLELAGGFPQ